TAARRPIFLCVLTVAAITAVILGFVMPMSMAYQPHVRTPYELPAHHAVFVHDSSGPPFTGHRVAPRATAGMVLICQGSVSITVDPDWRYTLALTFFGGFGLIR